MSHFLAKKIRILACDTTAMERHLQDVLRLNVLVAPKSSGQRCVNSAAALLGAAEVV